MILPHLGQPLLSMGRLSNLCSQYGQRISRISFGSRRLIPQIPLKTRISDHSIDTTFSEIKFPLSCSTASSASEPVPIPTPRAITTENRIHQNPKTPTSHSLRATSSWLKSDTKNSDSFAAKTFAGLISRVRTWRTQGGRFQKKVSVIVRGAIDCCRPVNT